jgi:hypothetical protein
MILITQIPRIFMSSFQGQFLIFHPRAVVRGSFPILSPFRWAQNCYATVSHSKNRGVWLATLDFSTAGYVFSSKNEL